MGIWVFGYGSLIYKPGFAYSQRVTGYIKGFQRVFHQGSTDHRGTPEAPGRTVTLDICSDAITWGAAYELAGDDEEQRKTLQYLEWREKQYDIRHSVDVFGPHDQHKPLVCSALVYIASPDVTRNRNYLGPAPLAALAQQIAAASGPSGPNYEYVFKLADAMRQMSVSDPELFELEAAVRALLSSSLTASVLAAGALTSAAVQAQQCKVRAGQQGAMV